MSKERTDRKMKLNQRTFVMKHISCDFCSNNKMHSNGIKLWCTKCKRKKKKVSPQHDSLMRKLSISRNQNKAEVS